jgi:SAM-dependent methyltransferase
MSGIGSTCDLTASHLATSGTASCPLCLAPLPPNPRRLPNRVECASCRVQITEPWPTDAELDRAYATHYRPETGRFSGPGDALLRWTRGRLAKRIDVIAPEGSVVDVGSGDGALLDALRAVGREAIGLERVSTRPDVRVGELEELEDGWAAIVMWHSLEHLRRPGAALSAAAERLMPGGVLVVAVPNLGSIQAGFFGKRWFALDIPRHLTHIPGQTLAGAIEARGLKIERVSAWRGGQAFFGWVDGLVGRFLPGHPSLYDAVRRPAARSHPMTGSRRALTVTSALAMSPFAAVGYAVEMASGRGGTTYVEARRG